MNLQRLFRKRSREQELNAELSCHVERQAQDLVRSGLSEEEARRQATLTFGGMELVKEECREVRPWLWFEQLIRDMVYAGRMYRHSPAFTGIVVLTLALGIGATTTISSFVKSVLLDPLPYPDSGRIVALHTNNVEKGLMRMSVSPPDFTDWQASPSFASVGAFSIGNFILAGDTPERLTGANVSSGYFAAMGLTPLVGRTFTGAEDKPGEDDVVVIGDSLWRRRFGSDPSIVGRKLFISDRPYTVIGVTRAEFLYFDRPELFMPLALGPAELNETERFSQYLQVFARLKNGVTLEQVRADMQRIATQVRAAHPTKSFRGVTVTPLLEDTVGPVETRLLIFFGAAVLLLLIACANVANLFLVRSTARQKEIGIRTALGAGRSRVARQLLTESTLLALGGGAIGVVLAVWGVRIIRAVSPANIPRLDEVRLDPAILLFALLLSIVTGLVFGIAPALAAARTNVHESLKASHHVWLDFSRHRLRSALVCTEVAVSLLLLIGAGLLLKNFAKLLRVDPGFDAKNVLTMEVLLPSVRYGEPEQRTTFLNEVLANVRAVPGVERAGATTNLPLSQTNMAYGFFVQGRTDTNLEKSLPANFRAVTPGYFETLHIALRRGRTLRDSDVAGGPMVMVINETMAKQYWPNDDPVGQQIAITRGQVQIWRRIVGIVSDVHYQGLHRDPVPEMYAPFAQEPFNFIRMVIRTPLEASVVSPSLREAVWQIDKDQPMKFRPLEDFVSSSVAQPRFNALLIGIFATTALALAAVGIYGVIAYTVVQRTREIGIRMALGADRRNVILDIVFSGIVPALIGVGIGLSGAFAFTRVLASFLFGMKPTDAETFAAVTGFFVLVAFVAAYIPARRAAKVDPMSALRCE
jgi:putative ABC transport system permease protein